MGLLRPTENRVKCGQCSSEFDVNKNDGCPMCGFGSKRSRTSTPESTLQQQSATKNYLSIPTNLKIAKKKGNIIPPGSSKELWGMVNSFFPGKAVSRVLGNLMLQKSIPWIPLNELVDKSKEVFQVSGVAELRGFPKDDSESALGRLVYHFIGSFVDMGLLEIRVKDKQKESWVNESWKNVEITLTYDGLEFAKLKNSIFDNAGAEQVLTEEERNWFLNHLKRISKEGFHEYSLLKGVFEFLKEGHDGKEELRSWFTTNKEFLNYVKSWSRKSEDGAAFAKQVENLATTFAAGKIALLRELGLVKNKRNDYTVIGKFK